jgi:hypothetical protein
MRPIVAPWLALVLVAHCGPAVEEPGYSGLPPGVGQDVLAPRPVPRAPEPASSAEPGAPSAPPPAEPNGACPSDMALVDTLHCPDTPSHKVGLRCLRKEYNKPNNLTICHEFAPGQRCSVAERRQRFCIDRFEYPNQRGAHPPVMVSAYDAAGLCAEKGKRLCWESEWTAACEGSGKKPFPYGQARSKEHCNIDNPYIHPRLSAVHSTSDAVRGPELTRLDQSIRSGAMEGCKSDFGVYDLTGNFDEWVRAEWERGDSEWAALKGGAWGRVRNACRPVTTSHVPHWSYYFISFRCCRDAGGTPPEGPAPWSPPSGAVPAHPAGLGIDRGYTPSSAPPGR